MTAADRQTLRRLAGQVRAISERPEMAVRKERWQRHNDLQQVGPMILCFPEGAWEEILPPETMTCSAPILRHWERALRMKIWWADHLNDDQVVEPWFDMAWEVEIGDYGVEVGQHQSEHRGSYKYDPPLKRLPDDFEKLRFRPLSVDRAATNEAMEIAASCFGDLLPPRLRANYWWTSGLTWEAIRLIGLEELMIAPYEQPESMHRLMAWLRDEHLNFITWFEEENLLNDQNASDYVGSGGIGYTSNLPRNERSPGSPARLIDRWGFAESQETVGMSPKMFGEFVFPYQLPILERFGLNYYGCCEPIESRWSWVKTIPRLRRVSVSPWSKPEVMAELLGRDYVFCRKPNPAPVCVGFQESVVREDLRNTLDHAGDCILEIILKDTHTVEHDPSRLTRWVQIAREMTGQ